MKVLGILASHQRDGLTAELLKTVLAAVPAPHTTETIFLDDYPFHPDQPHRPDPVLDELIDKLLASDVWVLAAPTYWGGLAGSMKNCLDCLRGRLVRFDTRGDPHPDRFEHKHYLSITSCYANTPTNLLTGVTDPTFRTLDKIMTTAGLIKIHEIVLTNTQHMTTVPPAKLQECTDWGQRLATKTKRDDQTMRRYLQLFLMVAIMALITMGLQLLFHVITTTNFWLIYGSFVIIFYGLLAMILHFFTVVKHRRH